MADGWAETSDLAGGSVLILNRGSGLVDWCEERGDVRTNPDDAEKSNERTADDDQATAD